ncbi:hypothetical protein D3C73_1314780 [compost metagenome]
MSLVALARLQHALVQVILPLLPPLIRHTHRLPFVLPLAPEPYRADGSIGLCAKMLLDPDPCGVSSITLFQVHNQRYGSL